MDDLLEYFRALESRLPYMTPWEKQEVRKELEGLTAYIEFFDTHFELDERMRQSLDSGKITQEQYDAYWKQSEAALNDFFGDEEAQS